MQIPNIPTDNLYKFTAIVGVVLVVLSLVVPVAVLLHVRPMLTRSQIEASTLDIEIDYLNEDLDKHVREKGPEPMPTPHTERHSRIFKSVK